MSSPSVTDARLAELKHRPRWVIGGLLALGFGLWRRVVLDGLDGLALGHQPTHGLHEPIVSSHCHAAFVLAGTADFTTAVRSIRQDSFLSPQVIATSTDSTCPIPSTETPAMSAATP